MKPWTRLTARLRVWFMKIEVRLCQGGRLSSMIQCRHVVDFIMSYLDGTLEPHERRAFEAHILGCGNCWRFLRSYRETVSLGRQLRQEDIPPDVRDRLATFLRNGLNRSSG